MKMIALSPVNDGVNEYAVGDEFEVADEHVAQLVSAGAAEPKKSGRAAKADAKKDEPAGEV